MDTNFENTSSTEAKKKVQLMVECIKYHLDDEECLRKSLLAVASLSATNTFVQDYLRENGCLKFILNIFTSNSSFQVKEATMFCLACAIDQNVSSQRLMTTSFVFDHLSNILLCNVPKNNLHHTATYFISCITNNNSYGQIICRKSSCLKNLLNLFRSMTDKKTKERDILENAIVKNVELLIIVCNAVCTCVNNPRNTENQEYCAKYILNLSLLFIKQCQHLLAVQSVIRLIAVLVASNENNQNTLREMNGIDVLVKTMKAYTLATSNVHDADYLKTAVLLTSALDTCLLDNTKNAELFGNYGGIEILVKLLHLCQNDTPNQIQIILAIAHATDNSDINQHYFVDCGGLVLVVNFFMQSSENTELQSALKYVLQICVPDGSNPINATQNSKTDREVNDHQIQPTKESTELLSEKLDCILQRLNKLESEGNKTVTTIYSPTSVKEFILDNRGSRVKQDISYSKKSQSPHPENPNSQPFKSADCIATDYDRSNISVVESVTDLDDSSSQCCNFKRYNKNKEMNVFFSVPDSIDSSALSPLNKRFLVATNISNSLQTSSKILYKSTEPSLFDIPNTSNKVSNNHIYFDNLKKKSLGRLSASSRKNHSTKRLIQENCPTFKKPLPNSTLEHPASKKKDKGIWPITESLFSFKKKCSSADNQNKMPFHNSIDVSECCCTSKKFKQCPAGNPPNSRKNQLLTSRNYNIILEVDSQTCHFHRYLREIERDLIKNLKKTNKNGRNTNSYILQEIPISPVKSHSKGVYDVVLSPDEHYITPPEYSTPCLPNLKRHNVTQCKRRKPIKYTEKEIEYLKEGVLKMGHSWNQIRHAYAFHPSRNGVDLYNKYKQMMKNNSCDKKPKKKTRMKNDFSMCEMRRLKRGVRKYGCNWTQILKSYTFCPKKTPEDLRNKWRLMNR